MLAGVDVWLKFGMCRYLKVNEPFKLDLDKMIFIVPMIAPLILVGLVGLAEPSLYGSRTIKQVNAVLFLFSIIFSD